MNDFLTGAGHFGFGFIGGTIAFLLLIMSFRKNLFVQLYAPFVPFLCGLLAALPYVFVYQKTCEQPLWTNIFFFYSFAHCHDFLVSWLANLHFVGLVCGVIYGFIIIRYIWLVRRVRRGGWYRKRRQ